MNALPAPPAPTVSGPANGTISNNGNVTVTGSSQAGAIVTVKDTTGANLGSVTVPIGGSYNVPLNLPPGAYTITVIATNAAGNSPPSTSFTVTVPPPNPVLSGPANGTTTANGNVTVSGTGYAGGTVNAEEGFDPATAQGLRDLGHRVEPFADSYQDYGAGQFIWRLGDPAVEGYAAASDSRRDGLAAGW